MNSTKPFPSSVGRQILALVGWVLLCFCAAAMGGLFLPGEWYASLKKPSWNPPGWIFGPMMAGPRGWSGDAAVDSAGL